MSAAGQQRSLSQAQAQFHFRLGPTKRTWPFKTITLTGVTLSSDLRETVSYNVLIYNEVMERAMGFEPTTSTLARLRSTPELRLTAFLSL